MTMPKTAIIWRASVYQSGKCPECGNALLNTADGQPEKDNLLVGVDQNETPTSIYCAECTRLVALVREYYGPKQPGLAGPWPGDS